MIHGLDDLRAHLLSLLPRGRDNALSAKWLARELGCSTRLIGQLVERAIFTDGACIGSTCSGDSHGYFLIADADDLEVGAGHTVRRAVSSLRRVKALRRNYERLGAGQTTLFSALDEVAS